MAAEKMNTKVLYIIVNVGFADEIAEITREAGATGATIMNARGTGGLHKSVLGITVDTEKEIVLTVVNEDISEKIIKAIKEKAGEKSPACGICFTMPVDKFTKTCCCIEDNLSK